MFITNNTGMGLYFEEGTKQEERLVDAQ